MLHDRAARVKVVRHDAELEFLRSLLREHTAEQTPITEARGGAGSQRYTFATELAAQCDHVRLSEIHPGALVHSSGSPDRARIAVGHCLEDAPDSDEIGLVRGRPFAR